MTGTRSAAAPRPRPQGGRATTPGGVTRLVAFAADAGASWGIFTLSLAAITFAIHLVTGANVNLTKGTVTAVLVLFAFVVWEFIYFAYQWTLSGKTIGMALLGIRVVTTDGDPIAGRQAVDPHADPPAQLPVLRARIPRHPAQQGPPCVARPHGQDRRRLLLGRPGRPTAVAGQAGADDPLLNGPWTD